jgi:MFS family permease
MLLSSGLWHIAAAMTWPFYSLYVLELGGMHADIGFISALGAVTRIVPTLFGGYLADSLGRKKILYSMTFLLAINELLLAFAPDHRWLYIIVVVEALAGGLRDPSFMSLIADSTNPDNRAFSMSLFQVGPPLFGLLSPYVMGVLMDSRGTVVAMRYAYTFSFLMATLASILRYRYVEETLTNGKGVQKDPRETVKDLLNGFKETYRALPAQLWLFLWIDFIFTLAWAVTEPYFVTFATEEVMLSAVQWGLVTMGATLIRTTLKPLSALASDRYGRIKFILVCMFLWPAGFLLFVNSAGFQAMLIARIVLAIAGSLGDPAWEALFVDYQPKEHRGRFSAIASVSWSLIWGLGNVVGGLIYQDVSKRMIFDLSAGLLIIGAVFALVKIREPEHRET